MHQAWEKNRVFMDGENHFKKIGILEHLDSKRSYITTSFTSYVASHIQRSFNFQIIPS